MGNNRFVEQDSRPQSNYFKEWRLHKGYRQSDVEKILRMKKGRISNLERGASVYTRHTLQALARIYECTTAQLLSQPPGVTANQSSDDNPAEISAASLSRLLDLAQQLQTRVAVLRDRVDAVSRDLKLAGDATDAAIKDYETLVAMMRGLVEDATATMASDETAYADAEE